jgi:hypothetical protein
VITARGLRQRFEKRNFIGQELLAKFIQHDRKARRAIHAKSQVYTGPRGRR